MNMNLRKQRKSIHSYSNIQTLLKILMLHFIFSSSFWITRYYFFFLWFNLFGAPKKRNIFRGLQMKLEFWQMVGVGGRACSLKSQITISFGDVSLNQSLFSAYKIVFFHRFILPRLWNYLTGFYFQLNLDILKSKCNVNR